MIFSNLIIPIILPDLFIKNLILLYIKNISNYEIQNRTIFYLLRNLGLKELDGSFQRVLVTVA
jgi:hypothetical protein